MIDVWQRYEQEFRCFVFFMTGAEQSINGRVG